MRKADLGRKAEGPTSGSRLLVSQLCHTTARRGAEVFASELSVRLEALQFHVTTRALVGKPDPQAFSCEPFTGGRRSPVAMAKLRRFARDGDVLVSFGSGALTAGALATRRLPTPFVYRTIGDPRYWGAVPLRGLRIGRPLRWADRIVALWPGGRDALLDLYDLDADKITIIPNGRDGAHYVRPTTEQRAAARARFGITDPDRPVLGMVAVMTEEKQPLTAVDVVARIPDAVLLLAGDGPLASEVAAKAERLAPGRIQLLGSVADPIPVYHAADAMILTSRTEGMPGCLIEGGLCGIPAVATDVGGTLEIVDDATGRRVEAGDVAATVAAVHHVLANRIALGAAAEERCRSRFTLDTVGDRWAELLTEVTSAAARR